MKNARIAAVLTWVYAAGFGVPAIPVAAHLLQNGTLPRFFDLFAMYGGPWSSGFNDGTFVMLLVAYLLVTLVASWLALLVWNGSRAGAVLSLVLLPIEAVFWIGFALPIPWPIGIARAAFLGLAVKSLGRPLAG